MAASWNKQDRALMGAVLKDNATKVKLALVGKKKADPTKICPSTQDTAAHRAAADGRVKIFSLLLESLTDVNALDGQGRTLLHVAAYNGKEDIVKRLMEVSAVRMEALDSTGLSALHSACAQGHMGCVRLLLLPELSADITDSTGRTALFHAAQRGSSSICRLLLEAGADINATDSRHRTALMTSVRHSATFEYLVNLGADLSMQDERGHDAVWHATEAGEQAILFYLARCTEADTGAVTGADARADGHPAYSRGDSERGNVDARPTNQKSQTATDHRQSARASEAVLEPPAGRSQGRVQLESAGRGGPRLTASHESLLGEQSASSTSLDSLPRGSIPAETKSALSKQKSHTIQDLRDVDHLSAWQTNTARSRSNATDVSQSTQSRSLVDRSARHSTRKGGSWKNGSGLRANENSLPAHELSGSNVNFLSEDLRQELSRLRRCYDQLLQQKDLIGDIDSDPWSYENRSIALNQKSLENVVRPDDNEDLINADEKIDEGKKLYFHRRLKELERVNLELRTEIKKLSNISSSARNTSENRIGFVEQPLSPELGSQPAIRDPVCESCGTELVSDRMRTLCASCIEPDQSHVEKRGHVGSNNALPSNLISDDLSGSDQSMTDKNLAGEAHKNDLRRNRHGKHTTKHLSGSAPQSDGARAGSRTNSERSSTRSSNTKERKRNSLSQNERSIKSSLSDSEQAKVTRGEAYIQQLETDMRKLRRELSELTKEMQRRNKTYPPTAVEEHPMESSETEASDGRRVRQLGSSHPKEQHLLKHDWINSTARPAGLVLSEVVEENRALKEELERRLSEDRHANAMRHNDEDLCDKNNNFPPLEAQSSSSLGEGRHQSFEAERQRLEERVRALQVKNSELVEENQWLQTDMENLRSVFDRLLREKSELVQDAEKLSAHNEELRTRRHQSEEDVARLQWDLKGLAADKRKAEERVQSLTDDLKDLEQANNEYRTENENFKSRALLEKSDPEKAGIGEMKKPRLVMKEAMQPRAAGAVATEDPQTKRSDSDSSLSSPIRQGDSIPSSNAGSRRKANKEDRPTSELYTRLKVENSRLLAQLESLEQEMNSRNRPLGRNDTDRARNVMDEVNPCDVNRESGVFSLPLSHEPNRLSFEFEAEKLAFEREMKKLRRVNDGLRTENDRLEKELSSVREDFRETTTDKSKVERHLNEFRKENDKLVNEKRQLELNIRELESGRDKLRGQPDKPVIGGGKKKVDRLNRELQRAIDELESPARDSWCAPQLEQPQVLPVQGSVVGQGGRGQQPVSVDSGCQTDDNSQYLTTRRTSSPTDSSPDAGFSPNASSTKLMLTAAVVNGSLGANDESQCRGHGARRDHTDGHKQDGRSDTNRSDEDEPSRTAVKDMEILRSELKELRTREREHYGVVGTYRSHLLAAIHGNLDPEVHDVLLRMVGVQ